MADTRNHNIFGKSHCMVLTLLITVYDYPCWDCKLLPSSRHATYYSRLVSHQKRAPVSHRKSSEGRKGKTGESHNRNIQENTEFLEMVCICYGIRCKSTSNLYSDVQMCDESNTGGKLYGESCGASSYFGIWLKSEGFSVVDRNLIPTGTSLISGTCVVIWGFLSDYTGSRFFWIIIPLVSLPEILVFA